METLRLIMYLLRETYLLCVSDCMECTHDLLMCHGCYPHPTLKLSSVWSGWNPGNGICIRHDLNI